MEHMPEQKKEAPSVSSTEQSYIDKHHIEGEVSSVRLYQGKRVELTEASSPQVLITEHLNGCTATVVVLGNDKTRQAQLVHFPPFFLDAHLAKIEALTHEDDKSALHKEALIYMSEKRKENLETITRHLKSLFGDDVAITHRTYKENTGDPDADVLAVEVPADARQPVIYHTQ